MPRCHNDSFTSLGEESHIHLVHSKYKTPIACIKLRSILWDVSYTEINKSRKIITHSSCYESQSHWLLVELSGPSSMQEFTAPSRVPFHVLLAKAADDAAQLEEVPGNGLGMGIDLQVNLQSSHESSTIIKNHQE